MSKTYIDFFETFKGEFIASLKFKNKFIKIWGTEFVDGIEVLKQKFIVYPGLDSVNVKRFLKLIGSTKSFDGQKFDGITSYYFFLNPTKTDKISDADMSGIIASKINEYIGFDKEAIVTLVFTGTDTDISLNGMTNQQIIEHIIANYNSYFNLLHSSVGNYLIEETIGSFLLFDNNQHFSYEILKIANSSIPYTEKNIDSEIIYSNIKEVTRYNKTLSVQIRFVQNSLVTYSSNIINGIISERKEENEAILNALASSSSNESSDSDYLFTRANESMKTNDVWYKGQLRTSFLNDKNGIKTPEKLKIFLSGLDTGFTKKKAKWWQKVLGPILIVIAIIIAVVTVGYGASISALLVSIATAVGVATMVMIALQSYWSKHGNPGAAEYMGRWVKIGSMISIVAGIGSIILNLTRMAFQQAAQEGAKQAMIQGGATAVESTAAVAAMDSAQISAFNSAMNVSVDVGIGNFVSAGSEMFLSSVTSSWQSMISTGMKVFKAVNDFIIKNRMENVQSEINSLTEERDRTNKELEDINDKEIHISLEDIKTYSKPLTIDNVRFEVDYLYEGTRMNIGRPSFYTAKGHNVISNDIYDINKI